MQDFENSVLNIFIGIIIIVIINLTLRVKKLEKKLK
jgi:hypothetical protein